MTAETIRIRQFFSNLLNFCGYDILGRLDGGALI